MNKKQSAILALLGRVIVGGLFLYSGITSAIGFNFFVAATASSEYLSFAPEFFAVSAILIKILGGALLVLGIFPRISALVLITFAILTAFLFHFDFSNQLQAISFTKNLMIAGGLLGFVAFGGGEFSIMGRK